jgi:putative oxidoreductase
MDVGLLIARLILGLGITAHGTQKLFGWFQGPGLKGAAGFIETLGYRPAPLFALLLSLGEIAGGLLTATGFLGAVGPSLIILMMLVAMLVVHWEHGFFASANGIELPLMFATGALLIASTGPGAYSIDAIAGLQWLWAPAVTWRLIGLSVLLALLTATLRRPPTSA